MKMIKLTQGQIALVDDDIYEELNKFKWHAYWDSKLKGFYAAINILKIDGKRTTLGMQRLVTNAPKGMVVDHINGDTLDNQSLNLRICSPRENSQNRHKSKSSQFPGVNWDKSRQKWIAKIWIKGIHKNLGRFTLEREAFYSYIKACEENDIPIDFMINKFKEELKCSCIP